MLWVLVKIASKKYMYLQHIFPVFKAKKETLFLCYPLYFLSGTMSVGAQGDLSLHLNQRPVYLPGFLSTISAMNMFLTVHMSPPVCLFTMSLLLFDSPQPARSPEWVEPLAH